MTKKEIQKVANAIVENELEKIEKDLENGIQYIARLRSCTADVYASDHYYILKSYSTIIAAIDADGVCYDFLRKVYGYTATSAKHISKFAHDYGCGVVNRWQAV